MSNEINILMREMSEGMNLSKEEVDFLTKKETFAMRLDRISTNEEQAAQTFSHESLIRVTGMFHLWLLGRINAKWRPSGYSKDSVPETFNVTGVIDWRNDE